jgi:hypothetical protein
MKQRFISLILFSIASLTEYLYSGGGIFKYLALLAFFLLFFVSNIKVSGLKKSLLPVYFKSDLKSCLIGMITILSVLAFSFTNLMSNKSKLYFSDIKSSWLFLANYDAIEDSFYKRYLSEKKMETIGIPEGANAFQIYYYSLFISNLMEETNAQIIFDNVGPEKLAEGVSVFENFYLKSIHNLCSRQKPIFIPSFTVFDIVPIIYLMCLESYRKLALENILNQINQYFKNSSISLKQKLSC